MPSCESPHEISPVETADAMSSDSSIESPPPELRLIMLETNAIPREVLDYRSHTGSSQLRQLKQFRPSRNLHVRQGSTAEGVRKGGTQHISYMISAQAQIVGEYAPIPCSRCEEGKGPFEECIIVPGAPQREGTQLKMWLHGGCANCFYHKETDHCTFRINKDAEETAAKMIVDGKQHPRTGQLRDGSKNMGPISFPNLNKET